MFAQAFQMNALPFEEHIDTDVSTLEPGNPGMAENNQPHGHRAQPFDVGPELPFSGDHWSLCSHTQRLMRIMAPVVAGARSTRP